MPTMVFQYGLLPPIEEGEYAREQMFLAHRYKNKLVEVERTRRERSREIERLAGDVGALAERKSREEERVRALVAEVKAHRVKSRSRSEGKELTRRLAEARAACKATRAAWSEARRKAREDAGVIAARKAVYEDVSRQRKEARAANGLHWGTGAIVDEAVEAASKTPLYQFDEPSDPSFKRWTGEGLVGVQVHQKGEGGAGLTVREVMHAEGDAASWLYITLLEPELREKAKARGKKKLPRSLHRARLHVRLGTREDGTPRMVCWPMIMHRDLPTGSLVKRIAVALRRVGPREVWTCSITVAVTGCLNDPAPSDGGTLAVEIGWRQEEDGRIRVATWVDDRGLAGEKFLPMRDIDSFRKADALQSTRRDNFNATLAAFVRDLQETGDVPEIVRKMTVRRGEKIPSSKQALAWLSSWESPARLAALCRRWREAGVDAKDRLAYDALESWRYHDHHLWAWESSKRRRNTLRRRELYRTFAAELASKYPRLVVNDANYKALGLRTEASKKIVVDAAALNRTRVSPGILRDALVLAFRSRDGAVEKVSATGISTTCPACGHVDAVQRDEGKHTLVCVKCPEHGRGLDQVACLNMLRKAGLDAAVDAIVERGAKTGRKMKKPPTDPIPYRSERKRAKKDRSDKAAE